MHSRQRNFFLAPDEILDVYTLFCNQGLRFIKSHGTRKDVYDRYDFVINADQVFQVSVYKSDFSDCINFDRTEGKGVSFVDIRSSYCIQFNLGGFYPFSSEIYHRSRFYDVVSYFNQHGELVSKGAQFLEWAELFLKEFKMAFLTDQVRFNG